MLLGVLHCIPDEDDPVGIVARLMAAVPPGSYLVVSHPAKDVTTRQTDKATRDYNAAARDPVTMRTHAEACRFFEGLDLVEPGVVQLRRWRPGADGPETGHELANYGGIGRKP